MSKRKILIVEDSIINRKILNAILSDSYIVLEAYNGQMALDILAKESDISAILLDLVMPVMDGYEFLSIVSKDSMLSQIPSIVMTQHNTDDYEIKALNMGAIDFLYKPYKIEIIKRKLINVINLRESAAIINAVKNDALTGLNNKETFFRKIKEDIDNKTFGDSEVFCLDIEKFKLINDVFGVHTGDKLLCEFANRLKKVCQKYKANCARINGDKFGIHLFLKNDPNHQIIEKLKTMMENYNLNMNLTVRIGIYKIKDDSLTPQAIFDRAQIASDTLRGQFQSGCAFYDETLFKKMKEEQEICNSLNNALKEGQFQPYYQPKVDLKTENIVGGEALVRWAHPQKGLIPPFNFISVFEKNGLICQLDYYLWDRVCHDIREWIDKKIDIKPISVNVSRADIYNNSFVDYLKGLIKKYDLPPELLHLEITESIYMNDVRSVIDKIIELRNFGFLVEMDDFGSGYSSLSMLADLPIDLLKLDISFMKDIIEQPNKKNILSCIVSLAKLLKLPVIAEGAETEEQINYLRTVDCNYAQGYYYSKPLPKASFEEKLKNCNMTKAIEQNIQKSTAMETEQFDNMQEVALNKDKTMLIIDDSPITRQLLADIFIDSFNVVQKESGVSALGYLVKSRGITDIILLDLITPLTNGFDLIEQLKSNDITKNIPIIAMSEKSELDESKAFKAGATDFISKPFNVEVLKLRVEIALEFAKMQSTERKLNLEKQLCDIQNYAEHDYITGLWNIATLESHIINFFNTKKDDDAILMMLDLDNFKLVNDMLGHTKGDEVLRIVSDKITNCFDSSALIARVGGDEFAIFIPKNINKLDLEKQMNKVIKELDFSYNGIKITASIGVATAPNDGDNYQSLFKNADTALLMAKRAGKNRSMFYSENTKIALPYLVRNIDWILDQAPVAVFVIDEETKSILYVNEFCSKLFKTDKSVILGKKCFDTIFNSPEICSDCEFVKETNEEYSSKWINIDGKEFLLQCKMIEWGGRMSRLLFLFHAK